jgi:uncharacterized protein YdhG (YjbR/CyaY superfamily)
VRQSIAAGYPTALGAYGEAMKSNATTVAAYLNALPDERRAVIEEVREVILANLPDGYVESMNWGMISYEVPLERYPDTYNKQPLGYVGLASQKNHMSLYLMTVYMNESSAESFTSRYRESGKKLDMGKSCVRFKKVDDLPLDLIGEVIAASTVEDTIAGYEASRG